MTVKMPKSWETPAGSVEYAGGDHVRVKLVARLTYYQSDNREYAHVDLHLSRWYQHVHTPTPENWSFWSEYDWDSLLPINDIRLTSQGDFHEPSAKHTLPPQLYAIGWKLHGRHPVSMVERYLRTMQGINRRITKLDDQLGWQLSDLDVFHRFLLAVRPDVLELDRPLTNRLTMPFSPTNARSMAAEAIAAYTKDYQQRHHLVPA